MSKITALKCDNCGKIAITNKEKEGWIIIDGDDGPFLINVVGKKQEKHYWELTFCSIKCLTSYIEHNLINYKKRLK